MASMPDLMNALDSFQNEIDRGASPKFCDLDRAYRVYADAPGGKLRLTYAKVVKGDVQVLVNFALVEPIEDIPAFNVGYAVKPNHRGRGLAVEAVRKAIEEMKNGFSRQQEFGRNFYVEAIVEASNQHSIRVAEVIFGEPGKLITDVHANLPALYYKMLVEF